MTKLIFDTETSGIPQNRLPLDHPTQPKLVELGMKLTEDDGTMIQCASFIVKPEGWVIPIAASNVHGITQEMATRLGVPLKLVVATFCEWYNLADEVVAHNEEFDDKIMRMAVHCLGRNPSEKMKNVRRTCTVKLSAPIVNLPPTPKMIAAGFNKPKAPNLTEAVKFFFNETFEGAHRALVDVEQCSRVYFEILRRIRDKEIDPPPAYDLGQYAAMKEKTKLDPNDQALRHDRLTREAAVARESTQPSQLA